MTIVWAVASIIVLSMLVGLMLLSIRLRRIQLELTELQRRHESLNADLNALCAGTVGVDRRILELERQSRELSQRQESLESRKQEQQPYGEAIQMIYQGASAESLVQKLGLNRGEAELMVMLHGVRKAS